MIKHALKEGNNTVTDNELKAILDEAKKIKEADNGEN